MKNKTILIVDDDQSSLNSLNFIFKKQKLNVFTAQNGKEALEILKKEKIDIVLTDYMMPDINGFELLKIVKGLNKDISVIMVTAYGTIEKAVEALKEGASDFIVKPLNRATVIKAVNNALKTQELIQFKKNIENETQKLIDFQDTKINS